MQRRPPVKTKWSIDTTTKSIITISVGLLTPALSDNVQPLALVACEAYRARSAESRSAGKARIHNRRVQRVLVLPLVLRPETAQINWPHQMMLGPSVTCLHR
ncbi:hypothetical protein EV356DRAFT_93054 [Viridothelium virens]|uniref:Uncharacterized protein n=1 Tax=Viridothelium virens TaxID=1048519 RepID=A0A6A6HD07_VIRVR|nr:hypothetical protein EV356DRAFT_93054 [Viridothelium virens]